MVLRSVKGEEGVGAVSNFIFHSGGVGGVDVDDGRVAEGSRVRAPPVRGEGVNAGVGLGGSSDGG